MSRAIDLDPTVALDELMAMARRHMKVASHAQASFDGWAETIRAALARRSNAGEAAGIKTWQERIGAPYKGKHINDIPYTAQVHHMEAEIADLREALATQQAAREQQEPVATVLMHEGEKIIDGSLAFMDSAPIGTVLYAAPVAQPTESGAPAEKCRYCGGDGEHYQGPSRYTECEPCNGTGIEAGAPVPRYALKSGDTREWLVPDTNGPWCRWDHVAPYVAGAPTAAAEPIYQVQAGINWWLDTDKAYWDGYAPESRRIVAPVTAPTSGRESAAPEAPEK